MNKAILRVSITGVILVNHSKGGKVMNFAKGIVMLISGALLCACSTTRIDESNGAPLTPESRYGVVAFTNNTETPLAGDRATSITTGLIRANGMTNVVTYHRHGSDKAILPGSGPAMTKSQMLAWGRKQHVQYVVNGTVNEWRYKLPNPKLIPA